MRLQGLIRGRRMWMTRGVMALAAGVVGAGLGSSEEGQADWQVTEYQAREVINGSYGDGSDQFGLKRDADGNFIGVATFYVTKEGSLYVADCVKRRIEVYDHEGRPAGDIAYPRLWDIVRMAVSEGRLYALGYGRDMVDEPARAREREACGAPYGAPQSSAAGGDRYVLDLLVWRRQCAQWRVVGSVLSVVPLRQEEAGGRDFRERIDLLPYDGEVYLYDPAAMRTFQLTRGGNGISADAEGLPCVDGRLLPTGVRAVKLGGVVRLMGPGGHMRDLSWLEGYLIGADVNRRLYTYEVIDDGPRAKVFVVVCECDGSLAAKWILPGRPGAVRMVGPRVVLSSDGAVFEFWSSLTGFHIVRWEASRETLEAGWTEDF